MVFNDFFFKLFDIFRGALVKIFFNSFCVFFIFEESKTRKIENPKISEKNVENVRFFLKISERKKTRGENTENSVLVRGQDLIICSGT